MSDSAESRMGAVIESHVAALRPPTPSPSENGLLGIGAGIIDPSFDAARKITAHVKSRRPDVPIVVAVQCHSLDPVDDRNFRNVDFGDKIPFDGSRVLPGLQRTFGQVPRVQFDYRVRMQLRKQENQIQNQKSG